MGKLTKWRRLLSLLLALSMMFSLFSVNAFAAEPSEAGYVPEEPAVEEVVTETEPEVPVETEPEQPELPEEPDETEPEEPEQPEEPEEAKEAALKPGVTVEPVEPGIGGIITKPGIGTTEPVEPVDPAEPSDTTPAKPPVPTAWAKTIGLGGETTILAGTQPGHCLNNSWTVEKLGLPYTVSDTYWSDESGRWQSDVVITITHGDPLEAKLNEVFTNTKTYPEFADIERWEYDFDSESKNVTITLYYEAGVSQINGKLVHKWSANEDGPFWAQATGIGASASSTVHAQIKARPVKTCAHDSATDSFTYDENGHTAVTVCDDCGEVVVEGTYSDHVFGEWNETEATYDAPGMKTHSCECGFEETEEIPQLEAVASIGEEKYGTLTDAVAAAVNGDTVVLLVDTTENVKVQGKSITLDLNGNTLNANGNALQINAKSNVTVTGNGTINATGVGVNMGGGTLTVESGTIIGAKGIAASGSTWYPVTINVNGGSIEGSTYGIEAGQYTTATINDGTILGTGNVGEGVRIDGQGSNGGQLNVNGGTITGKLYGITLTVKGAKATIIDGTIIAENPNGSTSAIEVKYGAVLTVKNGTIVGPVKGYGIYNSGSTVQIDGGTISGYYAVFQAASGKTTITDGYSTGSIYGKTTLVPISGGHFTVDVSDYVIDGYHCIACNDVPGYTHEVGAHQVEQVRVIVTEATFDAPGKYQILERCKVCDAEPTIVEEGEIPQLIAVASIGEKKFESLADAVTAAVNGDTVVLLIDTTENVTVQSKNIKLDLNGNTLNSNGNAIQINAKSNVTLTGNGTINATGTGINMGGGTLTVESGTIIGTKGIVASGSTWYPVTINVNGGSIEGSTYGIEAGQYTTAIINDGTISGNGNVGEGVRVTASGSKAGQLTVNGGTVTGHLHGIYLGAKGAIATVNGGTIIAENPTGTTSAIEVKSGATLTVENGTIVGPDKGYGVYNYGGTVTISGGTVNGYNAVFQAASGKTTITEGYFTGSIYGSKTTSVPISGGHFTVDVSDYVVDGLDCVPCKCEDVEGYDYEVRKVTWATISFTLGNPSYGELVGEGTVKVEEGESLGKLLPTVEAEDGYIFGGWYTEDGEEVKADTPATGNLTVTAKWLVSVSIKDNGKGIFEDIEIVAEVGEQIALDEELLSKIIADGKENSLKFLGWAESEDGEVVYGTEDAIDGNISKTLYAVWATITPVVPDPVVPETPAAPEAPVAPAATTPADPDPADDGDAAEIEEDNVPMAAPEAAPADEAPEANGEAVTIDEEDTPLAAIGESGTKGWSLLNLVLALVTVLMSLMTLASYFKAKSNMNLVSVIPAVFAVVTFMVTSNLSGSMTFADSWTPAMLLYTALNAGVVALAMKKRKENA